MNFESISSALVSAIIGGIITGIAAYISLTRMIAIIETKQANFEKDCNNCKIGFEARIFRLETAQMERLKDN
jgi:hypothetical protein